MSGSPTGLRPGDMATDYRRFDCRRDVGSSIGVYASPFRERPRRKGDRCWRTHRGINGHRMGARADIPQQLAQTRTDADGFASFFKLSRGRLWWDDAV